MAYPPRILINGGTYFVKCRCLNSDSILLLASLKDIVLKCISNTQKKYTFELAAFSIDDDNMTMVIRTVEPHATISKIMQHLKANITRRVNSRVGRTGTIWNERFSSFIIEQTEFLVESVVCVIIKFFPLDRMLDKYQFFSDKIALLYAKNMRFRETKGG